MQLLFSKTESIVWIFYSYALSKEQIKHIPSFYMTTELENYKGTWEVSSYCSSNANMHFMISEIVVTRLPLVVSIEQ